VTKKHGRIKAASKKVGNVLVKGMVAGFFKWLLDRLTEHVG
jgi:hypothetical protein